MFWIILSIHKQISKRQESLSLGLPLACVQISWGHLDGLNVTQTNYLCFPILDLHLDACFYVVFHERKKKLFQIITLTRPFRKAPFFHSCFTKTKDKCWDERKRGQTLALASTHKYSCFVCMGGALSLRHWQIRKKKTHHWPKLYVELTIDASSSCCELYHHPDDATGCFARGCFDCSAWGELMISGHGWVPMK